MALGQGRFVVRVSYFRDNRRLDADGLDEGEEFKYILVMMDDLSNFV